MRDTALRIQHAASQVVRMHQSLPPDVRDQLDTLVGVEMPERPVVDEALGTPEPG